MTKKLNASNVPDDTAMSEKLEPSNNEPYNTDSNLQYNEFGGLVYNDPKFTDEQLELLATKAPDSEIDSRRQGSGNVKYLASHYVIRTANAIFGPGQWETKIVDQIVAPLGPKTLYRTIMEVSAWLPGGIRRSYVDIGTGIANSDTDFEHDKAIKGSVSDAEKRCLRHFGDAFGLFLYAGEDTVTTVTTGASATVPAAQPRPPTAAPSGVITEANDPDNEKWPCEFPGCSEKKPFVNGFVGREGNWVTTATMQAQSQKLFNKNLCSVHYRNAKAGK